MANAQEALKGGMSGAGTGASIGSAIYPGIGTAIGAVGGAVVGALPSLLTDEAELANQKRLRELLKLQELDALGLTPGEKDTLYNQYLNAQEVQMRKLAADRNRQLSSAVSMGAGQGFDSASQREEEAARARSEAAFKVESQSLARKREMEDELAARQGYAGQRTKDRQTAGAGILKTGIDVVTEQDTQNQTISGPSVKNADITKFAAEYGISEDQAMTAMEGIAQNPELLQYLAMLGGK